MGHDDNYDKLLHAVEKKAALDQDKVLAEAQAHVRQIEAQTQAEIQQIRGQIQAEADRGTRPEEDRLKGKSQMAFRLARQSTRVRLLKQAFVDAKKALAVLPKSPQYRDILGALIAEALTIAGPDAVIKVASSEEALCKEWISQQKLKRTVKGIEAEPGTVLVCASDGDRQVDNGLATRLARAESLCQQDVAKVLFNVDTDNRGHA